MKTPAGAVSVSSNHHQQQRDGAAWEMVSELAAAFATVAQARKASLARERALFI